MKPDLLDKVLRHIGEFEFKESPGGWLRKGRCPSCGKKELYTRQDKPWVLRCGRLNHCGYEAHVKELYPELFSDWSQRTREEQKTNPRAAADLYLSEGRGFDLERIKGWYTQASFYDPHANGGQGAGSATVRFAFGTGYWERLLDRPERFGKQKAVFQPGMSYRGTWWEPPTVELAKVHKLWMVEGIFDAIALMHHGIDAVALTSCNNYPERALQELRRQRAALPTDLVLVWALDGDSAGRSYTRRWVEQARKDGWTCEAAQIPQRGKAKLDWNDLHQRDKLGDDDLKEYFHHGALLIARSASEKGLQIYRHSGGKRTEFDFDFEHRLYWFKLDLEAFTKELHQLEKEDQKQLHSEEELREAALLKAHVIRPIANCLPTALYYQENKLTDESWYYYRVEFPHDAPAIKNTFTSSQLSSGSEFKKRLLGIAPGAVFSGSSMQLERILERQLYAIQRVETIDFIGYSREHGAYVFGDVAVKDGRQVEINKEDFYEFGKLSLKTLNQSVQLNINRDPQEYSATWVQLLWKCFGTKGLAALTFWLGALFAEQIRATQKSYPFMEIVGEAGAGKSTLIEFLWKLVGRRDYEGFDPSKSSLAARARNFAQVANLPVVLIESDRERLGGDKGPHVKSFDWDELKTAYNGRSVRARGMATGGNETYEPPFRGAIVISQNAEVSASDAILQRICHLTFDRSTQTPKTREAAVRLEQMPVEQVSGWVLRVVQREAEILDVLAKRTPVHEQRLQGLVKSMRIAKNHGQLAALADALRLVVQLEDEQHAALLEQIDEMARERQQAINSDHPIVAEFWETFEFLDEGTFPLNHSCNPQREIAVNLNHFMQAARERNQQVPLLSDLKKTLVTSKRFRFVEKRVVRSALKSQNNLAAAETIWCWVFERPQNGPAAR